MLYFKFAGITMLIALGLWGLDRLALAAEKRGWIYYRKNKPSPGAVGNALLELQSMLQPSHKYVIEQRQEEKEQEDDQGDPPEPGADTKHSTRP